MRCSDSSDELETEPVVDLADRGEGIGHERAELHVDDAVGGHGARRVRATERSSPSTRYSANSPAMSGWEMSSLPSRRRVLMSEVSDAMMRNGSRWVGRRVALTPATGEGPNCVTMYCCAILDYWAENEETLGSIINHVLIHEIGHHFGLSDDDMEKIEVSVE